MAHHLRRIREHMALETRAIQAAADRARLFESSSNRGSEAEHSILRWLAARLGPDHLVSTGEIVDSFDTNSDGKSRQQDGIIHSNSREANRFLLPSGMRLVPIETVAAVVEVKLTVSKEEFLSADAAARQTAALRLRPDPNGSIVTELDAGNKTTLSVMQMEVEEGLAVSDPRFSFPPTVFTLFAFGGISNIDTIRDWMSGATISTVCCLSAGCIVRGGTKRLGRFVASAPDGDVTTSPEDSLWHFSDVLAKAVRDHSRIIGPLGSDFDAYSRYGSSLNFTSTVLAPGESNPED